MEIKPWEDFLSKNLSLSPLNSILWGFNQTVCAFFLLLTPMLCSNCSCTCDLCGSPAICSGCVLTILLFWEDCPYRMFFLWRDTSLYSIFPFQASHRFSRKPGCRQVLGKARIIMVEIFKESCSFAILMSAAVESRHHEHATTGKAIQKVLIFLSAMNIVLSSIFTSAVGCSVLPGIDCIHCKVAEAEHSLWAPSCHATPYLGLVGVGKNLSSSVFLCCILHIHDALDI